jgi:cobalt-zinc-cadmium efflux system membrane fusion protein
MTRARILAALFAATLALGAAADGEFPVTDAELARLGVALTTAEPVDLVELAAAPAKVVVPPTRQALASAPVAGVIARLLAAEGDVVVAGQALAELDSTDYVDRQRDFLDASAAAELAGAQEARDRGLFDEGIIAERRLAEARAAASAARARLEQARAQLTLAGLSAAELSRLAASRQLQTRLVLKAPLAGVVTAVHGGVGGRVDALDPVLAVADLRELWLEIRLPQESAARAAPGMSVTVEPPGGAPITGVVTTIGGVVDPVTQTVLVRATVDNSGGRLRAGQFLTARIRARPASGTALAVPAAAVTRHEGTTLVFVRRGGNVEARPVELLADDGQRVYVSAGLDAQARVAVQGISALKALWLASEEEGG